MVTDVIPSMTVSQDDSATIPSLIVSNFFTGATPAFEKLADLSAFAQGQYGYYASMGVGQPLLGPYEALGRAFGETAEFAAAYGDLTTDFVATTYNEVFGRAPSVEQIAHFDAQIAYFVGIYTSAGVSAENADLFAKGAVIGQMLGHAAVGGSASFDYLGAAKAFIAQMDDEGFVPGQPLSNFNGEEEVPPATGGGGGGGPVDTADYTFIGGVLTLTASSAYTGTLNGAHLQLVEPDGGTRFISLNSITKIVLAETGTKFNVDGAVLHNKSIGIDGSGILNVTGVGFQAAQGARQFEPSINLDALLYSSKAFVEAQSQFLVNGTVKDAIKVQWDFWDDKYVIDGEDAYTNLEINEATIRLGAKYVNDIDPKYGGDVSNVITDIVGKADVDGRSQLLHDNLLGNIGIASMSDRKFTIEKLEELKDLVRDEYESRPWVSGDSNSPLEDVRVAKAFDFAKGFYRPDYVWSHENAAFDKDAVRPDGSIMAGGGNPGVGSVVRHDGLGIEIGLKGHYRTADAVPGVIKDGVVHFEIQAGSQKAGSHNVSYDSPNHSAASLSFTLLVGDNGTNYTLEDFLNGGGKATLTIDKSAEKDFDPSEAHVGTLQYAGGDFHWAPVNGFNASDTNKVSADSFNWGFLGSEYADLKIGTYDVFLTVEKAGVTLQNHVIFDIV